MVLDDIGRRFYIAAEKVRQVKGKAINKLTENQYFQQ